MINDSDLGGYIREWFLKKLEEESRYPSEFLRDEKSAVNIFQEDHKVRLRFCQSYHIFYFNLQNTSEFRFYEIFFRDDFKSRKSFCKDLQTLLKDHFKNITPKESKDFSKYFILPLTIKPGKIDFKDQPYEGISLSIPIKNLFTSENTLDNNLMRLWKTHVFNQICQFQLSSKVKLRE